MTPTAAQNPTEMQAQRNETGQTVAHRGTNGWSDWLNNGIWALGGNDAYKKTARYKEAEKVQRDAEQKYGAKNVTTIGHSQGGLQAELPAKMVTKSSR